MAVASAAGLLTQIGSAPYAVSKHAAVAFAEWLSVTYGSRGIRVTCVCPMGVDAEMLRPGRTGALEELGASAVRAAGDVLSIAVAEQIIDGIRDERFLITPHPEVVTFSFSARPPITTDGWRGCGGCRTRSAATEGHRVAPSSMIATTRDRPALAPLIFERKAGDGEPGGRQRRRGWSCRSICE